MFHHYRNVFVASQSSLLRHICRVNNRSNVLSLAVIGQLRTRREG